MSDIGSSSRPNITAPDSAARVAPLSTASDNNPPPPEQQPGKNNPEGTRDNATLPKGHDPAVSIAASLAQLQPGTQIIAELNGVDSEGRPLLVSPQGTYVLTPPPSTPPAAQTVPTAGPPTATPPPLTNLPAKGQVIITVQQVDKSIRAEIFIPTELRQAQDTKPLPARLPVQLTLTELSGTAPVIGPPPPPKTPQLFYGETPQHAAERLAQKLSQSVTSQFSFPQATQPLSTAGIAGTAPPAASAPAAAPSGSLILLQQLQSQPLSAQLNGVVDLPPKAAKSAALSPVPALAALPTEEPLSFRVLTLSLPGVKAPVVGAQALQSTGPLANLPFQVQVTTSHFQPIPAGAEKTVSPFTLTVEVPTTITKVAQITVQSPVALPPGTVLTLQQNPPRPETVAPASTPAAPSAPVDAPTQASAQAPTQASAQDSPQAPAHTAPAPSAPSAAPTPATPPAPITLPPQALPELLIDWQNLAQLQASLTTSPLMADSTVTPNLNGRLPSLSQPAQISSSMLLFLTALGHQNPARLWLGPDMSQQLEQQGHRALLGRLDADMVRIGQAFNDPGNTEWRPALIPFQTQDGVQALAFLFRPPQNNPEQSSGKDGGNKDDPQKRASRFVVEMNLSQLGELQLDGLLKPKQLDLIVRSHQTLPPTMQNELQDIFAGALGKADYQGKLSFQTITPFPLSAKGYIQSLNTRPPTSKVLV